MDKNEINTHINGSVLKFLKFHFGEKSNSEDLLIAARTSVE